MSTIAVRITIKNANPPAKLNAVRGALMSTINMHMTQRMPKQAVPLQKLTRQREDAVAIFRVEPDVGLEHLKEHLSKVLSAFSDYVVEYHRCFNQERRPCGKWQRLLPE